jgi:hypothetical protein
MNQSCRPSYRNRLLIAEELAATPRGDGLQRLTGLVRSGKYGW